MGVHRDLAKERDKVSEEFYEGMRRAKALNQRTTQVTDASFNRTKAERNNLKRLALPKFGGKPEPWPDFRISLKTLLGTRDAAIEICLHKKCYAANKFILGVFNPAEAWTMLDRQFGNRDITIAIIITGLIALKIPKGPGHEQVGPLLQGMCSAQACLRAVQAKAEMLTGLGTVGKLVSKLPDD